MKNNKPLIKMTTLLTAAVLCFALFSTACRGNDTDSSSQMWANSEKSLTTENSDETESTVTSSEETVSGDGNNILVSGTKSESNNVKNNNSKDNVKVNRDATVKETILSQFKKTMSGKTVTLMCWWDQGENEKAKFKKMQEETGVKVKFLTVNTNNYETRLSALINAGSSPDIVVMTGANYPNLAIKGYFQDISVTKANTSLPIYDKELMNYFKWNGKNYGLAVKYGSQSLFEVTFYNKTMFTKKGVTDPGTLWAQNKWNWDTFLGCAKAMTDSSRDVWGVDLYYSQKFLPSVGMDIVSVKDGKIVNNLSDNRIVKAWTFINELNYKDNVTTKMVNSESAFATGKIAMLIGESWQFNKVSTIPKTMKDEWDVVPMPCPKGTAQNAVIVPQVGAIPIGARNAEAAAAVYAYWVSYDTEMQGQSTFANAKCENFMRKLWDLPKIPMMSEGIYSYGGNYTPETFNYDITAGGLAGVQTSINKWSSLINVNIDRILKEFS